MKSQGLILTKWAFLSNHGHVRFLICKHPDLRMRDMAHKVEITERAVQQIIHSQLEEVHLIVSKEGRRDQNEPALKVHPLHPLETGITIGQFSAG